MSIIDLGVTESVAPDAEGGVGAPEGRRVRGRYTPQRLVEAARLMQRVWEGDYRAGLELREALSTSDFGAVFGATMDRQLLTAYQAAPSIWQRFASRRTVANFKPATLIDVLGGLSVLGNVPELTEYPARKLETGDHTIKVAKRGARFALSWETLINDELDVFRDIPQRLAQAARNTEDFVAAGLVEVGGNPNPGFFTGNAVLTGNPALTSESLEDALQNLGSRKDQDGNPIITGGRVLMVGPALEMTARRILNASEIRINDGARTIITGNTLSGAVELVVNPWLSNPDAWYVLPAPGGARPAVQVAFLRGHETPEIRVKGDTGNALGGGQIAATDGSFDIDDIQYRARHILGGATLLDDAVLASNGTGA